MEFSIGPGGKRHYHTTCACCGKPRKAVKNRINRLCVSCAKGQAWTPTSKPMKAIKSRLEQAPATTSELREIGGMSSTRIYQALRQAEKYRHIKRVDVVPVDLTGTGGGRPTVTVWGLV